MLTADLREGNDLVGSELVQSTSQRLERPLIREDLRGLLQRFVLIDGDQHGRWTTAARHGHVLASISDLIEEIGKSAAELADGNSL